MFSLRRAVFKAVSSSSFATISKPRTFTNCASPIRISQFRLSASSFQKRFLSEEAATTSATAPAEPAAESTESADSPAVTPSQNRSEKYIAPAAENDPQKILYVGNLFFEVTEQALSDQFSQVGPVVSTKVIKDHRGLSKGFGYVEFESAEDASRAIEEFNQTILQGRSMVCQHHRPKPKRQGYDLSQPREPKTPTKTLFIGNMSFEMSDKDLNDLFRQIRNVLDVRVAIDRRTGQPRGFAHADFVDVESATKALEVLKGKELYGRKLRIDYSGSTST